MDDEDKLESEPAPVNAAPERDQDDPERRAVLAALGKMAALTPPAVLTLLMSKRASAAS